MAGGAVECSDDLELAAELALLLDAHLANANPGAAQVGEMEQCQEQLVAGTNVWMSYNMDDNTITHAKFFQELGSDEYQIECVWPNKEAGAAFEYSC